MTRLTTTLLISTALIAVAGCAGKPKTIAPLAQSETPPAAQPPAQSGPVGDAVVPGSAADFKRSAQSEIGRAHV